MTTKHNNPTQVAFKYCATFNKCLTKTDRTTTDDAEDLDLVMPMYSLVEYSSSYSVRTASLWFYSKDEATTFHGDMADINDI